MRSATYFRPRQRPRYVLWGYLIQEVFGPVVGILLLISGKRMSPLARVLAVVSVPSFRWSVNTDPVACGRGLGGEPAQ